MSGEHHGAQHDMHGACIYLLKPIRFDRLEATFEHLRQCLECDPSDELQCTLNDDRHSFGINDQQCPFMQAGKKTGQQTFLLCVFHAPCSC